MNEIYTSCSKNHNPYNLPNLFANKPLQSCVINCETPNPQKKEKEKRMKKIGEK